MNIKRTIINTIVRRLTWLALAAVLAWLGIGHAHAVGFPHNPTYYACYWYDNSLPGTPAAGHSTTVFTNQCTPQSASGITSSLCSAPAKSVPYTQYCTYTVPSPGGSTTKYTFQIIPPVYNCPANSTLSDGLCHADAGFSAVKKLDGNWVVVPQGSEATVCPAPNVYNDITDTCGHPSPAEPTDAEKAKECANHKDGSLHWPGAGCLNPVEVNNGIPVFKLEPIAVITKKCEQEVCPSWGDEPNTAATIDFGQSQYTSEKDDFCPHSVSSTGVLGRDGNDPDCAGYPNINFDGNTTYSVTFEDPPQETTVKSDTASNTVNMNTKTAENGNTRSDNVTFGPPTSNGSRPITGTSRDYYAGTGSNMGSSPITPVHSVGGSGGGSGGEGEGGTCEDCAKEATLQEVLDAVSQGDGSEAPTTTDERTGSDVANMMTEANPVTSIMGFQVPAHTSQCPTATFSIPYFGETYVMDAQCEIIEPHASTLQVIAAAMWLLMAIMIILGA